MTFVAYSMLKSFPICCEESGGHAGFWPRTSDKIPDGPSKTLRRTTDLTWELARSSQTLCTFSISPALHWTLRKSSAIHCSVCKLPHETKINSFNSTVFWGVKLWGPLKNKRTKKPTRGTEQSELLANCFMLVQVFLRNVGWFSTNCTAMYTK
jgi:hypothetical protein